MYGQFTLSTHNGRHGAGQTKTSCTVRTVLDHDLQDLSLTFQLSSWTNYVCYVTKKHPEKRVFSFQLYLFWNLLL